MFLHSVDLWIFEEVEDGEEFRAMKSWDVLCDKENDSFLLCGNV